MSGTLKFENISFSFYLFIYLSFFFILFLERQFIAFYYKNEK